MIEDLPDLSAALLPAFFGRDPVKVARELLGCLLARRERSAGGEFVPVAAARIVETEAYDCPRDPSCHVIEKLPGARQALLGPPGRLYFHKSYEHRLLNVVCMPAGHDATILIRAAEPLFGLAWMRERRAVKRERDLMNGPAKLVQALGLEARLDGESVDGPELFFAAGDPLPPAHVTVTARVGLRVGRELPWRFFVTGNPWVSPGKPSA